MAVFPGDHTEDLEIPCPTLDAPMPTRLWSAPGSDPSEALPLLTALDDLEYDRYSSLTQLLDYEVSLDRLPPMRAALLHPVQRERAYSASENFTRSLAGEVRPHLSSMVTIQGSTALAGGHGSEPGRAGGALRAVDQAEPLRRPLLAVGQRLQSPLLLGRFEIDHMGRICNFTESLLGARLAARPAPAVLTCGMVEETCWPMPRWPPASVAWGTGHHCNACPTPTSG